VRHLSIAVVGILASAVSASAFWHWSGSAYVLGDTVAVDKFSVVSRFVLLGAALVGCLYYTHYASRDPGSFRGEFYPLTLFATAGMTLITAANDLIVIFLALELLSLSLYVLTGITGRRRASAAAMKYFLFVAFMGAATKVAAFFALIRVFDVGLQPLTWDWTPVLYALAVVSIVVGSFLAIAQRDVKRLLAYSSIAHAGFILTGLTAANSTGIRAAMFYLVAYAAVTLGAFGLVMLVSARGEDQTSLDAYAGLARRSPGLAALMTVFLLSLAGIPPTAGFIAKVTVFSAAIGAGNWPLAVVGVVASVVAAYFYLRVIVYMYMREPAEGIESDEGAMPRIAAGVLATGIVVLGVFPGILAGILEPASIVRW